MHEVALASQVAQVVARSAHGRTVTQVRLLVGAMRQVVPDSLAYAWDFAVSGTNLAGAVLEIELRSAVIRCQLGHETTLGPELGFNCEVCGSTNTAIIDGEQFQVIDIEVE